MTSFLIGQRGTGKSSLLKALGDGIDLDQWIAKDQGKNIRDIFEDQGEAAFRQLETHSLAKVMDSRPSWVSLGAGFPMPQLESWPGEKIWVRRASDQQGRVFLDRPRLNPGVSPLEEFDLRAKQREPLFQESADWVLEIPEGQHLASGVLKNLLTAGQGQAPCSPHTGIWTLSAGDSGRLDFFEKRVKSWGFQFFEMRTDLLGEREFLFWAQRMAKENVLLSYRNGWTGDLRQFFSKGSGFYDIDWALELGAPPLDLGITSFSLHSEGEIPLQSSLQRLNEAGASFPHCHLKWAPVIKTWKELSQALQWQSEEPQRRSLLPRSGDGRWSWVRQALKSRQKLNFIAEFKLSDRLDQPTIVEWLQGLECGGSGFTAILGAPVTHSWTPSEQSEFFKSRAGLRVLRVHVEEWEWNEAWPVLNLLGLRAAAVTSPLKKRAFEVCDKLTDEARALESVNTLVKQNGLWRGDNTDRRGFAESLLQEGLNTWPGRVLIWGGGGTLSLLRLIFPKAEFYSVRSQSLRSGESPSDLSGPLLVVWAAGARDAVPEFPCEPKIVLDLNYREDSRAREFALDKGARYISGEGMFIAQASLQRVFWSEFL